MSSYGRPRYEFKAAEPVQVHMVGTVEHRDGLTKFTYIDPESGTPFEMMLPMSAFPAHRIDASRPASPTTFARPDQLRTGQRIRVSWDTEITEINGTPSRGRSYVCINRDDTPIDNDGDLLPAECNIEILSEPTPDEPTGLGAVVKLGDGTNAVMVSQIERNRWTWQGARRPWQYLVDHGGAIEVLSPGVE